MIYAPGTYVDLTFLNRKVASTFQQTAEANLHEVGTSYVFKEGLKAFRRIPVQTGATV